MSKREDELEDPGEWDFDKAEEQKPTKQARVVASVAFSREDYERISQHARRHGMRTSEFIRTAAVERMSGPTPRKPSFDVGQPFRADSYTGAPVVVKHERVATKAETVALGSR